MRCFPRFRPVPFGFLILTAGAGMAQPPGTPQGKVQGRVLQAATSEPVEYATIALLAQRSDSVITGTLARGNGDFVLGSVPAGTHRLRVSSVGFETLLLEVTVDPRQPAQDLGDLRLNASAVSLEVAEVTAERSQVSLQVDRRVYNVDKDLSSRGATALDVMKNVPGLSVDVDGGITLRNASPQLLIDGRPTTLSLEQIPSEEIERVEVITTPGAAFDAGTTGGIVNVVLKKSTRPGYSGQLQGGAGTNGRLQGSGNLNMKEDPIAMTLSYNANLSDNLTDSETDRIDRENGEDIGTFTQDGESSSERLMHGGRLGVDLNLTNRSTLSVSQSVRSRGHQSDDEQDFVNSDPAGTITSYGEQVNTQEHEGRDLTSQLAWRHTSPKPNKEWTADLTYNRGDRSNGSTYTTTTHSPDGGDAEGSPRVQQSSGTTEERQWTFQFDAADPLNERHKVDWGGKGAYKLEHNVLDVQVSDSGAAFVTDSVLSSEYRITDGTAAAYINWAHKLTDHWSLLAGLRLEPTFFEAELPDAEETFSYRYPDGGHDLDKAIFPSLYFSRKWADAREFQVNFSRKINRPRFWQVMPFVMFSDSRSYRIGNPALAPELTGIGEVNHLLPFGTGGRSNWLTSAFVRYTADVITSYTYPKPDDPEVLVSTFVNGDASWTYGWDNTVKLEPRTGLQITLGAVVQYVEVGLTSGTEPLRNSGWMFTGKMNASQRIAKDWVLQVNGEYEGPKPVPQGHSLANYGVDLSVGADLNKRFNLVASLNDVFNTRRWGSVYDTDQFYLESYRRREQRYARLTLTWKFGEQNTSLFRRKGQQRREPGQDGGEGEGF